MRFLVLSGVDVTRDVGDVVMETAAAWVAKKREGFCSLHCK